MTSDTRSSRDDAATSTTDTQADRQRTDSVDDEFETPNVVFVTVDSLRADYIFGPDAPDSLETLPRLADEGIAFTDGFSNAAYTKSSFLSIMSGTYPWAFDPDEAGYESDRPHVAELLSEAGYDTAGFHTNVYLSPTYNYDRGFDHYLGRDAAGEEDAVGGLVETAYSQAIESAVATRGVSDVVHRVYKGVGKHLGIQLGSSLYKPAEKLNDAVVEWTRTGSGPQFVWVHYMDVHNPYYPHEGTVSEGISRQKAVKLFHRVNELRADAADEDIETLEQLYRGEIEYFDRQLGDLLDRLDETLGLDDTLVVFTSDHGEAFDEHGHVYHPGSALYDENVHVPIIVDGPGVPSADVETPVSNLDLVPTILSMAGVDRPPAMDGTDVIEFVADPPEQRLVFSEAYGPDEGKAMVTDGAYKLIRDCETGDESLYDRRETPSEARDYSEELPQVCEELAAALDDHVRSVARGQGSQTDVEVTEDVRLQLRKLGYDE